MRTEAKRVPARIPPLKMAERNKLAIRSSMQMSTVVSGINKAGARSVVHMALAAIAHNPPESPTVRTKLNTNGRIPLMI